MSALELVELRNKVQRRDLELARKDAEIERLSSKWMPIEAAPKDGTILLICFESATQPIVHIAWYRSEEQWHESGQYCGGWDSLEDWLGWWSYTENSVSQTKLEGYRSPTHWMPLPELPN